MMEEQIDDSPYASDASEGYEPAKDVGTRGIGSCFLDRSKTPVSILHAGVPSFGENANSVAIESTGLSLDRFFKFSEGRVSYNFTDIMLRTKLLITLSDSDRRIVKAMIRALSLCYVNSLNWSSNDVYNNEILQTTFIDPNKVYFMHYHGVVGYQYAVGGSGKQTECIICDAQLNLIRLNDDLSVSCNPCGTREYNPLRPFANRISTDMANFCVWYNSHSNWTISDREVIRLVTSWRLAMQPNLYYHVEREQTYGHFHKHVVDVGEIIYKGFKLKGEDLKAFEFLRVTIEAYRSNFQKGMILNRPDDIFHPVDVFYANCSDLGRNALVARQLLFVYYEIPGYDLLCEQPEPLDISVTVGHLDTAFVNEIAEYLKIGMIPVGDWFMEYDGVARVPIISTHDIQDHVLSRTGKVFTCEKREITVD